MTRTKKANEQELCANCGKVFSADDNGNCAHCGWEIPEADANQLDYLAKHLLKHGYTNEDLKATTSGDQIQQGQDRATKG